METESQMESPTIDVGSEARQWAMFCHLAGLLGGLIPAGNVIGPLVLWQMKKEEFPFVDDQGKEALNFQLSVSLYLIVSGILVLLLVGIFLLIAVGAFALIFTVIGGIQAHNGVAYRYPAIIRFVK